ncbi:MAG TPA: ABC-type transport auxiliary lipoprotein family protein [Sulfuricurvum sp.]|nr:ABC-type transport auxiliary lipoprotein family protein [Sulfuricurvum sp.]
MKTIFLAVIATFLFTGCSTLVPQVNEFSLLTIGETSTQSATITASSKTLQYQRIKAPASLSSKAILYTKHDQEVGRYLYSSWSDTPASMMESSTIRAVQESRLFANVIPSHSQSKGDYSLESDLNALYHQIHDSSTSEGLIDITYRLIDSRTRQCIATKRLIITYPADTQDAKGGVKALKKGMDTLHKQTIQWLKTTIDTKKL